MCRRWVDDDGQVHEEAFLITLTWMPSTMLTVARPGRVHRVDAAAADRFEQNLRDRAPRGETEDVRYTYLAWVDGESTQDDPTGLLRTWPAPRGIEREQRYTPGSGWDTSYVRDDWHRGRYDGRFDRIDQETAEQIIQMWEQRRAEQG
ncbi:hypothetical protein SAMN04488074_1107 [Lentzea albidocapillata subsp. violacea]|uniref:Uncharacterized protein n=2 Tax=Lentzea albidocapillata TaxID=40571 RepID=A0A1G9IPY6_9PSEU|nr:hypothetical protein SAMN04488074_1107 [Lentzea albidocapillata subsp. violacea]